MFSQKLAVVEKWLHIIIFSISFFFHGHFFLDSNCIAINDKTTKIVSIAKGIDEKKSVRGTKTLRNFVLLRSSSSIFNKRFMGDTYKKWLHNVN